MLLENQQVSIHVTCRNIDYYKDLGFENVNTGDYISLNIKDALLTTNTKVLVKCDYCEKIIIKQYGNYLIGQQKYPKDACNECKNEKIKEKNLCIKNDNLKEFNRLCENKGYISIATINDYFDGNTPLPYICPLHGMKKISFYNLKYRDRGCRECGRIVFKEKMKASKDKVINDIESKNNNKLLNPDEYINAITPNLNIKCGTCKNIFTTSRNNYSKNVTGKCPNCNVNSIGEYYIAKILDKYNIGYIRQHKFDDCRDKKPLPFDFYLPSYNMCIEFDGQGHRKIIYDEKTLYSALLHDGMKNNYCKWNNITLLRISYLEGNNIEQILLKTLHLFPHIKYIHITK